VRPDAANSFVVILLTAAVLAQAPDSPPGPLPANGTEPAWSNDGTRLAFGVSEGEQRSLWTMDADGTNARRLVAAAAKQHYLRWFPDDSRLVFVAAREGGHEFRSIRPDGSDVQPFLPANAPRPELAPVVWSPDGKRVAYCSRARRDAMPGVVVVELASGEIVGAVAGPHFSHSPRFSPDGERLVYLAQDQIWIADADARNATSILAGTRPTYPADPGWLPDGRIHYTWNDGGHAELQTVRPDGTDRQLVYRSPLRCFYPSWSPAAQRWVLAVRQTDSWDLWLFTLDRDGKNLTRLVGTDNGAPIFELLGAYTITGQVWPEANAAPRALTGQSTWSRALGGHVVRESAFTLFGRRPLTSEWTLTRCSPGHYQAVLLDEENDAQQWFAGSWDPAARTLTFDRVSPSAADAAPRELLRHVWHFTPAGALRKTVLGRDAAGAWQKQAELTYTRAPE
jgi:Tol biopolymer transport system component